MSTTFRRHIPQTPKNNNSSSVLQYRGTKPWTGGVQLTSTGLRELDALLTGGGQALHSCILLIKEERFTDLSDILTRYWVAQGLSHGQKIVLVPTNYSCVERDYYGGVSVSELETCFIPSLPKNMHVAKLEKIVSNASGNNVLQSNTIIEEEEEGNSENDHAEENLKIAWQYRRDIQNERRRKSKESSSKNVADFCHSFDLGGCIQDDLYQVFSHDDSILSQERNHDSKASIYIVPINLLNKTMDSISLFRCLIKYLKEVVFSLDTRDKIARILIQDVDPLVFSIALPLLQSSVRSAQLPVCFMCTVRPEQWHAHESSINALTCLKRSCDVVFSVDSFCSYGDPPGEFRDLAGIFSVHKLGGLYLGQLSDKFAPANRYGLKRDRRKLHLQMLHLPPEDFAMGGSSVGSGARRSGGTKAAKKDTTSGCDSATAGSSSSLLDF